jgi:3-oxoacyl-(acyl-carrier-protein) synthase
MVTIPPYRAVITGIGCVSPFGVGGYDLVAEVLKANVSAIQPLTSFPTAGLTSCLGAEVPAAYLPETEEARRWSRLSRMTVLACRQAVAEAGLCDSAALCQAGLVVGSQYGDLRSTEAFCLGFLRKGPLGLSPLLFPSTVMNAMAGMTSIALGLKGPMLTLNQSGVAGELAVARAMALLRAERAPAVIACGVDELFPLLYETLVQLRILSPRGSGEEACRPFDQHHNGPILGEGATAVVLELPEHAQARGAPMLAEIRSACWGGIPARLGRFPVRRQGPYAVLDRALTEAAVCPEDVGMAYLSSCGDPQHDAVELACMADTFGTNGPLLTSVTHMTGEYGGLGAFRVAAATVTVRQGINPTLDYLHKPIRTDVRFALQPVTPPPAIVLVHGLAPGGVHTAILIGRLQNMHDVAE